MDDRFSEEHHGIRRSDGGWALVRSWETSEEDPEEILQTDYHILPVGDCGRHWTRIGCPCSPRVERILQDGLVYVHRALDDRVEVPDPLINSLSDLLP